ncbi:hypothetical protein DMJ13_11275 [halophilic archaeon]|nr:hypothetical protein DMJ13_11275 [halophilic archaeon]
MWGDKTGTKRRDVLKLLGSSAAGITAGTGTGTATSCSSTATSTSLSCGTWYSGTVNSVTDGDTAEITVDQDGKCYEVRFLGIDTPETSGNTEYEKTQEWEFIEDPNHLETWGNNASDWAKSELEGATVEIQLDCEADKMDPFDRLLAFVKYDQDGDGTRETVYNESAVQKGYARTYAASMSETDEYVTAEATARGNGTRVWQQSDGTASEVKDDAVAKTFHPHTSSIKLGDGSQLPDSRAPLWAESEAVQDNTTSSTVDYSSGDIPLVGVDDSTNIALFGGLSINEDHESDTATLEHFVFTTNLIDALTSSSRSGHVLIDGGHHTFGPTHALSCEDVAYYQRYLEGQDLQCHPIHTYGDSTGFALADARALIVTGGNDAWTASEVDHLTTFISNGGAVILMGSHAATATQRENLDALANDLGTDLRLNDDDVHDSTNNAGNEDKLTTTNFNTADFSLWTAYSGRSPAVDSVTVSEVETSDADAEFDVDWTVSDPNDDLSSLDLSLSDDTDGESEDAATVSVSGGSASGTTRLIAPGDDGAGHTYTVEATVTDSAGNTDTASAATTESDGSATLTFDVIHPDGDNYNEEYVDITNAGTSSVDVSGYTVEDSAGHTYTFPSGFSLDAGATVRLHSGDGTDSSTDLYWNNGWTWNNGGDTAYLFDDNGSDVAKRSYTGDVDIRVGTIQADGDGTLNDEWVEFENHADSAPDMDGFHVEDEAGHEYWFTDDYTITADGTCRLHTGDGTSDGQDGDVYWGSSTMIWNNSGDTVSLYDEAGDLHDSKTY